jgi:hypothetical protein
MAVPPTDYGALAQIIATAIGSGAKGPVRPEAVADKVPQLAAVRAATLAHLQNVQGVITPELFYVAHFDAGMMEALTHDLQCAATATAEVIRPMFAARGTGRIDKASFMDQLQRFLRTTHRRQLFDPLPVKPSATKKPNANKIAEQLRDEMSSPMNAIMLAIFLAIAPRVRAFLEHFAPWFREQTDGFDLVISGGKLNALYTTRQEFKLTKDYDLKVICTKVPANPAKAYKTAASHLYGLFAVLARILQANYWIDMTALFGRMVEMGVDMGRLLQEKGVDAATVLPQIRFHIHLTQMYNRYLSSFLYREGVVDYDELNEEILRLKAEGQLADIVTRPGLTGVQGIPDVFDVLEEERKQSVIDSFFQRTKGDRLAQYKALVKEFKAFQSWCNGIKDERDHFNYINLGHIVVMVPGSAVPEALAEAHAAVARRAQGVVAAQQAPAAKAPRRTDLRYVRPTNNDGDTVMANMTEQGQQGQQEQQGGAPKPRTRARAQGTDPCSDYLAIMGDETVEYSLDTGYVSEPILDSVFMDPFARRFSFMDPVTEQVAAANGSGKISYLPVIRLPTDAGMSYGSYAYYMHETVKMYNICTKVYDGDLKPNGELKPVNFRNKCSPRLALRQAKIAKYEHRLNRVHREVMKYCIPLLAILYQSGRILPEDVHKVEAAFGEILSRPAADGAVVNVSDEVKLRRLALLANILYKDTALDTFVSHIMRRVCRALQLGQIVPAKVFEFISQLMGAKASPALASPVEEPLPYLLGGASARTRKSKRSRRSIGSRRTVRQRPHRSASVGRRHRRLDLARLAYVPVQANSAPSIWEGMQQMDGYAALLHAEGLNDAGGIATRLAAAWAAKFGERRPPSTFAHIAERVLSPPPPSAAPTSILAELDSE